MSALPSTTPFEEYLNEQLINCLNYQTNVIQNLAQYSQHIALQLIDIKNNVEILANRVVTLQQQTYVLPPVQIYLPPSNPLYFPQSLFQISSPSTITELTTKSVPFSFSTTTYEQPSPAAPFVFNPIISNNTTHPDDEVEDESNSDDPTITYKPIIHLPPVETKTGEEDENILFCERAKLYRFDSLTNEMKERGTGEIKILQHKTKNLCRVLMRREQVLRICANHAITPQMELKEHQGKENTFIWSATDFSDGDAKHEVLCVKLKTNEQAKKFAKVFNKAKESSQNKIDDDIIAIGEVKPTREQIERARKLQLPLTFYLYENKAPCKGCRGCKDDLLSNEVQFGNRVNSHDDAAAVFGNLSNFPSGFFPNSSLPSLMSMVPTWFSDGVDSYSPLQMPHPPKDCRMIIKAKRSLPSNRLPPPPSSSSYPDYEQTSLGTGRGDDAAAVQTFQKKSRNFSGHQIETFSVTGYASQMAQNILDRVKQELHKQIQITKESQNSTSQYDHDKPSSSSNSTTSIFGSLIPLNPNGSSVTNFGNAIGLQPSTTINSSSMFTFGNKPKLSFSDLAKQSPDNQSAINDNEKKVFSGQGSLIFSTSSPDTTDTENNNNDEEEDTYEPPIPFKPIVHLLPVETKTGEEDENILFREHAKLYRFDSLSNEMKERGIGEMKILQHKTTNLCRVLMRRYQVFKVCANHRITPQMELKEHQEKANAFIWSAVDYADREAKNETLCVKFKTSDQAKRFFQQFNDAKQTNPNIQQ